jgi:cell division protein FtsI/penicillin-binding protein 2
LSGYFKDKEPKEFKQRIFAANIFVISVFFVIFVRFWYLRVKEAEHYRELSQNNRLRLLVPCPARDRHDRLGVKVADNRRVRPFLVPEDVVDWAETKDKLKKLAGIEAETIDEALEEQGQAAVRAVKLKEDLSWEETVR